MVEKKKKKKYGGDKSDGNVESGETQEVVILTLMIKGKKKGRVRQNARGQTGRKIEVKV
jgi:hypothetical protein